MVTEWALRRIVAALRERASRASASYELTGAALSEDRVSVAVEALPEDVTAGWYPYAALDLGAGVARVVRSIDVAAKRLTWQRPLLESEAAGATVTVASSPLAGAAVYLGGGPAAPVTVTLWCNSTQHLSKAVGHQYGSRAQRPSLLVGCRTSFVPDSDDSFEAAGLAHLRLVEQVAEVVEYGLGEDCVVALPETVEHDWWREGQGGNAVFVYAADIRCELEVRT